VSSLSVFVHDNSFAARVEGLSLAQELDDATIAEIRSLWLSHQVLYFPNQPLEHEALERFTKRFGDYGDDPYVKAIDGHENILEVRREPDEAAAPFGGSWHSDWSFQSTPPSATILHSKIVPPQGGDTHYADGFRAYDALDPVFAAEIGKLTAIHSARRPYSHEGYERTQGDRRSMTILPSDKAWETREHPMIRTHPESGRRALWVNPVYTIGIKDIPDDDADALLAELFSHALQPEFIYQHKWAPDMLIMWDNRSVQHCAQGGYDGHRRIMHRTTVAGTQPA
jgi:taurine dioxygenase